ncbi:hypothetical protein F5883DRAFT_717397, partial [Diaporthe sp. PMI_573]
MEISASPVEKDLSPDQSFFLDQVFFNTSDHNPFSAQEDFSQLLPTVPLASTDQLGTFGNDGYQTNHFVKENSPFNGFRFNPIPSQAELSQTTVLTTAPSSPLIEKAADNQIISTVSPHFSSGLIPHEDTTDLPHVNFQDLCKSPTTYSSPQDAGPTTHRREPSSEKAVDDGDNLLAKMYQLRNKNANPSLAQAGDTSSMPELNTPADSSIMVASDLAFLDETNHLGTSSIEEASASVPNAPAKKSKAGKIGRPTKRRSVDAHNNIDRPERPWKRYRPHPTLEELDKRIQNGDITANQEITAESPTPELPFRPEDIEKLLSPVNDSPLNGDFLDTIVQHLVACNRHVTAIPGRAWAAGEPGENTLPCDDSSIFILPVNINERLASMVIHMAQHKAMLPNLLMDKQVKEDHQKIQQLASLFVSNCLPEPYNNWDERWTTQLYPSPQQSSSRDSD